ncbi:PO113 protein, partial [Crypturellus soui]|nr:PO113 protein [Crypturellus soui]
NSPTLCQLYVAAALAPLRSAWPECLIYHYMDDILFCQKQPFESAQIGYIADTLDYFGLPIAKDKIQMSWPWKYLGWLISDSVIRPQKLTISAKLATLHDAQRLLGDLQWVRPVLGLRNEDIAPLLPLLKGTDPAQPISVSPEQLQTLQAIADKINSSWTHRAMEHVPFAIFILHTGPHVNTVIAQWRDGQEGQEDKFYLIEWVFGAINPKKNIELTLEAMADLIKRARLRTVAITGEEPVSIHLPMAPAELEWALANSSPLQSSVLNWSGTLTTKFPSGKLGTLIKTQRWAGIPLRSERPLAEAVTVFTDAGGRTGKALVVWLREGNWHHEILEGSEGDSLQILELMAVCWAFNNWMSSRLNIVSDSLYVVGVVERIEDAAIRSAGRMRLVQLFRQLQQTIRQRSAPYCIIHISSHQLDKGL